MKKKEFAGLHFSQIRRVKIRLSKELVKNGSNAAREQNPTHFWTKSSIVSNSASTIITIFL
jgi:hypothetical protein